MTKPIVAWPGGKRRLAKHILPLFEIPHRSYIEPFSGGAALLFMRPNPAPVEVLNDINADLISLYRCVQHHLDELLRQFRWSLVSRQMYDWMKLQRPETLTDIQRAARFLYMQKLSFGAKVSSRTFGATMSRPRLNFARLGEDLSEAHLRLSSVTIECLPWDRCMVRYDRPDSLMYLDPPYWETEGYGVPFPLEQYERLADVMSNLKGKAVLSINDHPEMRRIFGRFKCMELSTTYTIGGQPKAVGELLFTTW